MKKNKKKKTTKRRPKAKRPRPMTRNPRAARKKAPKKQRRNVAGALLSALIEGTGFAAGEHAFSKVVGSSRGRKKKSGKKKRPRRNPGHGLHAVAVGGGRRKLIIPGPKQKIQRLAAQLRSVLGSGRVRTGKLVRKETR